MIEIVLHFSKAAIFVLLLGAAPVFLGGCTSLFFFPTREYVATPDELGLKYDAVSIPVGQPGRHGIVPDLQITGWKIPATSSPVCGTVILFHGNAQNMSNHLFGVSWLPAAGYNLFVFDYRGYGKSDGHAVVSSLIGDGEQVLGEVIKWADNRAPNGSQSKIVVYGQSIGGALATPVVARTKYRDRIAAVILESSFYSYPGIVREKLGQFFLTWPLQYPLSWLFYSKFSPADFIGLLAPIPVLIIHGQDDPVIGAQNSAELFKAANQPKQLWEFDTSGHINVFQNPKNREKLTQYLRNVFGCNESSPVTIK